MSRLPSTRTLSKAAKLATATLETACAIWSPGSVDDGFADVDNYGLRDVSVCRIHKLGEQELTDEMRARNAEHFSVVLPAGSEIVAREQVRTTWIPAEGEDAVAITLQVVEANTPRQTTQVQNTVIAYKVS